MKKIILILSVAIMMAVIVSCNKKEDVIQPEKTYAKFVSGEVVIQNGDVTFLKSAPTPVTEKLYMYKGVSPNFTKVDGSEFLTGSAPAIFWSTSGNNPGTFLSSQTVYSNYTPAIQVRMVAETLNGSGVPAYLGIFDVNVNSASFPVHIYGKRLGDVLTLNTNALTALPGYTNMSFDVVYTKNTIDVEQTVQYSPATTATSWPVYVYSASPVVTTTITGGTGDQTVYDGLDAKITGTITINIHVDGATIPLTTAAVGMGNGLAITLTTSKVGWYDSENMAINHDDIIVNLRSIAVN